MPGNTDVVREISIACRVGIQGSRVGLVGIHIVQIILEAGVVRHHPEETHLKCLGAPAAVSVGDIIDDQCCRFIGSGRPGAR